MDEDLLEIMKDDDGHFYAPALGHNNSEGWFIHEDYVMKMNADDELKYATVAEGDEAAFTHRLVHYETGLLPVHPLNKKEHEFVGKG